MGRFLVISCGFVTRHRRAWGALALLAARRVTRAFGPRRALAAVIAAGGLLVLGSLPAFAIPGLTASGTGTVMTQLTPLTVATSNQPEGVAVAGTTTYVSNPPTHSVLRFDAAGTYLGDIALGAGSPFPTSIVASSDGSQLFVTDDNTTGSVFVISTATNTVVNTFPVVGSPGLIALSHDGSAFYLVSNNDAQVYAYATSNGAAIANSTSDGIYATAFHVMASPDGTKVYETMRDGAGTHTTGGIRILNAADLSEIGHTDLSNASGLAESADGSKIWVGSTDSASQSVVAEFDPNGTFTGRTVAVSPNPENLLRSADGNWLYVAGFTNASLDVIDTRAFTDTLTAMTVGTEGLALSSDGLRLYAANPNTDTTEVVSIAKLTLTSPLSVAPGAGPTTFSAQITDGGSTLADYTTNTVKFDVLNSSNAIVATGTVAPNAAGAASASLDLSALPAGTYSVRATLDPVAGSVVVTAVGFRISAAALAATGTAPVVPSVIGALLLLAGAAALIARRRRAA